MKRTIHTCLVLTAMLALPAYAQQTIENADSTLDCTNLDGQARFCEVEAQWLILGKVLKESTQEKMNEMHQAALSSIQINEP